MHFFGDGGKCPVYRGKVEDPLCTLLLPGHSLTIFEPHHEKTCFQVRLKPANSDTEAP